MYSFRNSTKELSDSGIDTAVISVGATEQCGPYLPLHIDTLCAAYFAEAWGELLSAYVLPTLPFNTSEEHSAFRGTITLRPTTVMLVLEEVVECLHQQGFRKQILTVGHGGSWWMNAFIKNMNWKYKDLVLIDAHRGAEKVWEAALKRAGLSDRREMHGGALSRSLALFLTPESVSEGEFGSEVAEEMEEFSGYVTWDKITPDGSWGRFSSQDGALATAESGRVILDYFVQHQGPNLKQHLEKACQLKGIIS